MEQLSIEEKAARYDEAIEKAKDYYHLGDDKHKMAIDAKAVMEYIFPELKESEDERIRKKLIDLIYKVYANTSYITCVEHEKMLAWLEKQGEPVEINPTEFDTRLQYLIGKFDSLPKEELIGSLSFWLNVVQNNGTYKSDEKQGEQKPADKVEPKFKVGDWIFHERSGNTFHINRIDNRTYISDEGATISFGRQNDWRLWNIQDAKNGDVLCYETKNELRIFIYKNGHIHYHCCYYNGHLTTVDSFFVIQKHLLNYIYPATKEQRDLLFQKMKEAEYEWDAEKKELKKIEQKPATNLELDENEEPVLTPFEAKLFSMMSDAWQGYLLGEEVNIAKTVKEHSAELLEAANEQNPAWSEEDEKIYNRIYDIVHNAAFTNYDVDEDGKECGEYAKITEWFKSLKERVQPQPKNEWSEEDVRNIQDIDSVLFYDKNLPEDTCMRLRNWLKSLKDRYTWFPSDEQMKQLGWVAKQNKDNILGKELMTLYKDLKKLK